MRLQKWEYDAYAGLLNAFGQKKYFTIEEAMERLAYPQTAAWKVLNELGKKGIIAKQRLDGDWRTKKYRLLASIEELSLIGEQIPTNKLVGSPAFAAEMGYMPSGTQVIFTNSPAESYKTLFKPGGTQLVTIRKGKYDDSSFAAERIKARDTAFASRFLQSGETRFSEVVKRLNSFDYRYFGAVADILLEKGVEGERTRKIITALRDGLFKRTEKDDREFSVYPKDLRKQPKELDAIAKKWRIYLNLSPAEVELA
ncbi:MAG: hypothetical protein V1708_03525 [Candidatus Micrarchaeota archaeon]